MGDDDAPIRYDAIHQIACALAQKTNPSFRGSPADREEIASLVERLNQYAPRAPAPELSLSERVKRINPVIHRAYELFVGTKQYNEKVDVRGVLVKPGWFRKEKVQLGVFDNPYTGKNNHPDCGVVVILAPVNKKDDHFYAISRLRLTWKRSDMSYNNPQVIKCADGESIEPNACIDIRSLHFKIDCMPPEDFVRSLTAGGSEIELRQATLDHLLSLPEILGPYLDRKERGEIVSGR